MAVIFSNFHTSGLSDPLSVPKRRETSHRRVKGRSILDTLQSKVLGSEQTDDFDEATDSDTDPVWTPQKDDQDDEDVPRRRATRKPRTNNKNNRNNAKRGPAAKLNSSTDDVNICSNLEEKPSDDYVASVNNPDGFRIGDFIVARQDALLDCPAIWRVDSKTLLQKFEPFHINNKTLYRSLSTYAQWSPENQRSYILAKCVHVGQQQHEMHVELQRKELCLMSSEMYIEKIMQDATVYQDQFEVYVQTLISQALDSNFLIEIMQEQDEYFISNVKAIDDLTNERKVRLRNCMPWPAKILYSIETWPCYNINTELGVTNNGQILCVACNKRNIVSRVILYGQPYNPNTIGPTPLDNRYSFDKDFLLCHSCITLCELFHKISHQKYLMFMQCSHKVAEKNGQDPTKGTTVILNELLADEVWLSQLFKMMRRVWGEVDQTERQHRYST